VSGLSPAHGAAIPIASTEKDMTSLATKPIETKPRIVSRKEWLAARKALLARERELTHLRDRVNAERRELAWVKVEEDYVFDAPEGKVSLADLFDGRSQLAIYHFMLTPGSDHICDGCAFLADHVDAARMHFQHADLSFAAVSRAPLAQIEPFRRRMGWRFKWISSNRSDFNSDYHVSFTKDDLAKGPTYYNFEKRSSPSEGEAPGLSVFYKNATGEIFHTYSAYARGLEVLDGAYHFIDLAPKGRDEEGLPFPGAWWRHHDRYAADTIQARHAE
jgi:predicted dithiol-disulfide oxidoreductase (DUF899 family)